MSAAADPAWERTSVTASDGLRLAAFTTGPDDGPTVLLAHGYPDTHHVWDAVAGALRSRFRVVTWDARGAGESDTPAERSAYRLDQLAADQAAVAAAHADGPVHLIAHDWGSIAAWHAVTREGAGARFGSLTSVSGPSLAYAGAWLRHSWRDEPIAVLKQSVASSYLGVFRVPRVAELFWRSPLGRRALAASTPAHSAQDAVAGLQLYRANLGHGGAPRPCTVPTLVLAPRRDRFVTPAFQTQAPARWTADLRTAQIDGGHWTFVRRPQRLTDPFVAFVDGSG